MVDYSHHNVTDNVHDLIRLTNMEHQIMNAPLFNRLHYVYQNSSAFLTWPSVRIQRFEHSLGTMHLAGQMFYNALCNTSRDTINAFASNLSAHLYKLIETGYATKVLSTYEGSSWSKEDLGKMKAFITRSKSRDCSLSPLIQYTFMVPSNVPKEAMVTCMYLAEGVRLAGMLHDIGHPPFSHVCEHVLNQLYHAGRSGSKKGSYAAEIFVRHVDSYLSGKNVDGVALHEVIGNRLSSLAISQGLLTTNAKGGEATFRVVAGLSALAILNDEGLFKDLHALVSGTVDADRMDFVQRDSKASGVGTDALQYRRLCEDTKIMLRDGNQFVFAMSAKTLPTVEDFLRKRLLNYKTIVFHHRVVKSEALMEAILKRLAERYFEENAEMTPSDGPELASDLYILPNNVSGLWQPLAESLGNRPDAVLAFSQWNDAWLMTTLRGEYTRLKIDGESSEEDGILQRQLAELLYSEKLYQTIVKRSSDCIPFREELRAKLDHNRAALNEMLDACENRVDSGSNVSLDGMVFIEELRKIVNCDSSKNILRMLDDAFCVIRRVKYPDDEGGIYESLEELFKAMLMDSLGEVGCDYRDVMVHRNRVKTGLGGESSQAYFLTDDGSVRELREISAVGHVLEREAADAPAFYAYVYMNDDKEMAQRDRDSVLRSLGRRVYGHIESSVCTVIEFVG